MELQRFGTGHTIARQQKLQGRIKKRSQSKLALEKKTANM